jgi:hypothetical protein
MIGSSRSYAIGMAHYQLAGGLKSLLGVCIAYIVLFFGGLSLYLYADMSRPGFARAGVTWVAITVLIVFETFVLLIFGSNRIAACIRLDLNSKMIESHRLMPVPAWRAVAGYMFGGGAHAIAFAAVNLLLALGLGVFTGTSLSDIVLKQMFLVSFSMLIWSGAAMATFLARHAYTIAVVVLILGGCLGAFWAFVILPGLAILVSPMFQETIFTFSSTRSSSFAYPLSFICQGAFFSLFFVAACRRYRGTYALSFPSWMALLLLMSWSASSVFGHIYWKDFFFSNLARDMQAEGLIDAQVVGSVIAAMLISFVAICSTVFEQKTGRSRLLSLLICLVTSMLIACASLGAFKVGSHPSLGNFMITWLTAGAFVVTAYSLVLLMSGMKVIFRILVIGFAFLMLWLGPLILEVVRAIAIERARVGGFDDNPHFGLFGNLSPIGLLVNSWVVVPYYSRAPGLIAQWIIALALLPLALFISSRLQRPQPLAAAGPSPLLASAVPPVLSSDGSDT